jgi:mono/diheme cytochrome c family protein
LNGAEKAEEVLRAMIHWASGILLTGLMLVLLLALGAFSTRAQQAPGPAPAGPGSTQEAPAHGAHGTPAEWKFAWPKGDPAKGREVFVKLECYSCHEVRGEMFPAPADRETVGPELSAMGPLHSAEYFAEAIINPSATIEKGKAYEAADGSSKMPSFNDVMSVQELVDLVAFLRGLKPPGSTPAGHGSPSSPSGDRNQP